MNPKISAYAQIHGKFSYIHIPIAPPEIECLILDPAGQRESWAPQSARVHKDCMYTLGDQEI